MLMERVQVGVAQYEATGETARLQFFAQSEPYNLWGFIPMSHKFIQLDSENTSDRLYLLGSDSTGRDIFSRLLYGSQISLSIGLIGISITLVLDLTR